MSATISSKTLQQQIDLLTRHLRRAQEQNHRLPLILAGDYHWLAQQLNQLCRALDIVLDRFYSDSVFNDGEPWHDVLDASIFQSSTLTPWRNASQDLGKTARAVVVDLTHSIPANGVGITSGTVQGGGLFIMLCPLACQWPQASQFLQRCQRILNSHNLLCLNQDQHAGWREKTFESPKQHRLKAVPYSQPDSEYATQDQQLAVQAIKRVKTGHRRRPLVLTADRGRGKSAALGIAAAQLMGQESGLTIIATGPSLKTTETLFAHAEMVANSQQQRRGQLSINDSTLLFMAPDELAQQQPEASLVLVDEAAALPAPLLEKLLQRYARIVFASTIHGYEGTGRGFAIRFRKTLDRLTPKWQTCQMHQPVRWANHDPLESFVNELLLLDSTPAVINDSFDATHITLQKLQQQDLANNEQLLSQVFGLLVCAHYQTHPDDLQHMLDQPDLTLFALNHQDTVVAVMLLCREGGFDHDLAHAIWAGTRRPKGHLLPQTLAMHAGHRQAAELSMLRIMRVAVHPQLQNQGLGQRLIGESQSAIATDPQFNDAAILGSCFGATDELLGFWQKCGLNTVHIGSTRNSASGCYSATVVKALNPQGDTLCQQAQQRFSLQLPRLAALTLDAMECSILTTLLAQTTQPPLTDDLIERLQDYVIYKLPMERVLYELERLTVAVLPRWRELLTREQEILMICRFIQNRPWSQAIQQSGLSGKKAADAAFIEATSTLLDRCRRS